MKTDLSNAIPPEILHKFQHIDVKQPIKIFYTINCEEIENNTCYEINACDGDIVLETLVHIPDNMTNQAHDIAVACLQAIEKKFQHRYFIPK